MAHGDVGELEAVSVFQAAGELSIEVQVVLTYADDAERADGATVTAVAIGPDGTATDPVTLAAGTAPGAYTGTIAVPGEGPWHVEITSTAPAATLRVPDVEVASVSGTTATTVTTAAPEPLLSDDGGPAWGGVALTGVLVAIGAAAGYWLVRRNERGRSSRRRPGP